MPKNVKGGSKHKKMKNTSNNDEIKESDLILKSGSEQDYGKVEKILGNGRFNILCNDKVSRLGIIRGKMRKREWVNMGSIVLYSNRDYEKDKVDILHVYSSDALKMLEKKMKLSFNISDNNNEEDDIFYNTGNDIEIPEKKTVVNTYYNFSSSDDEEVIYDNGEVIDDDYIDNL